MSLPLAEQLRPTSLEDVIGQVHVVGEGQLLHQIIANKQAVSLILWGPPGSGKTTLARIIAQETGADWIELSAVTSGVADVRKVIERAEQNQRLQIPTLLFVDEIHRFNKAQQDAFLPHVEKGTITLIGATTENPSFEIITPLLSRSRVVVLEPLNKDDMKKLLKRAAKHLKLSAKRLPAASIDMLAELSGGDGRVALGNLEVAQQLSGIGIITKEIVQMAAQRRVPGYDKNGENHYNLISAFIKSLRGSDANAALYYMARILQAGEDPKFLARRMVIFASEDIGIAAPAALNIAVSTFQAVTVIGLPEAKYNLYHCATVLAKAPKSREVTDAMISAEQTAREHPDLPIPLHLRNAPTSLMKDLGYSKDYKWQADFKHKQGFLPPEIDDLSLFGD
ncbi:replication-associated recombination protein A [Candidatus Saccharibacteria bacterium]|nr:MAG: replication-associated recombination protein A [Candidatus Saccharibacteria bacterium]TXG78252.1 MAG: replication-associated recombination protein A [Patescibacteria group bacterium]